MKQRSSDGRVGAGSLFLIFCFSTILLLFSVQSAEAATTQTQRAQFLNAHNAARFALLNKKTTGGAALFLPNLTYSLALETLAQSHVSLCLWSYNQSSDDLGENLYLSSSSSTTFPTIATAAVNDWLSEATYYTQLTNTCTAGHTCAHYTQVVWANTTSLGCAIQRCSPDTNISSTGGWFVSCYYSPAGNIAGMRPYEVCMARSCGSMNRSCGMWDNGCGVNVSCGSCSVGQECHETWGVCSVTDPGKKSAVAFGGVVVGVLIVGAIVLLIGGCGVWLIRGKTRQHKSLKEAELELSVANLDKKGSNNKQHHKSTIRHSAAAAAFNSAIVNRPLLSAVEEEEEASSGNEEHYSSRMSATLADAAIRRPPIAAAYHPPTALKTVETEGHTASPRPTARRSGMRSPNQTHRHTHRASKRSTLTTTQQQQQLTPEEAEAAEINITPVESPEAEEIAIAPQKPPTTTDNEQQEEAEVAPLPPPLPPRQQ